MKSSLKVSHHLATQLPAPSCVLNWFIFDFDSDITGILLAAYLPGKLCQSLLIIDNNKLLIITHAEIPPSDP